MDQPKRKSKNAEEYDQPTETELYKRMLEMPEPFRSYAAFTYLFGNRVTEGIKGKSKYKDRKTGQTKTREFDGIKLDDFTVGEDGWIQIDHVPTLKRKVKDTNKFYRELLVYSPGKGEEPFLELLERYLLTIPYGRPIWTHSRKAQWHHCDKYLKIPPKVLRSMRAKKDAQQYKLGALELKEKYNWGSVDMPFHYAKFNKTALKKKIEDGNKT